MIKPHSSVHSNAHSVLELLKLNWRQDKELQDSLLAHYELIEQASDGVMETIDSMVQEKQRANGH